jgi:lipoprotein-anchoring transpeptidase ErfK/SrfK
MNDYRSSSLSRRKRKGFIPVILFLLFVGAVIYMGVDLFRTDPVRVSGAVDGNVEALPTEDPAVKEVQGQAVLFPVGENGLPVGVGEDDAWVKIVKERFRLYVYRGEQKIAAFPVAIGEGVGNKEKVGDRRTPEGTFKVVQIQDASYWTHDFGDGKGPIDGAYGPVFIRLETGWKGIGIHGTHDPSSIEKRVTEGCIRLTNENVEILKGQIGVGTVVVITP